MTNIVMPYAEWAPPPPPTDLIFDDGIPLESNRHRIAMNLLIHSLNHHFADRTDFFAGGNMFVYYSVDQAMNRDFRGPDFFVTLGVDSSRERQGWVVWNEGGRYPDVIVELLSPSTTTVDRTIKKDLYEQVFHTSDYFIFDPFDPQSLAGWHLIEQYQPLSPNPQGWLWCETLGLWLGTWQGSIDREPPTNTCHWLRFYDPEGNLVLLAEEAAQQHAQAAEVKLEQTKTQLEQTKTQLEQTEIKLEQERQKAEQEAARAQALANRLRSMGIEP